MRVIIKHVKEPHQMSRNAFCGIIRQYLIEAKGYEATPMIPTLLTLPSEILNRWFFRAQTYYRGRTIACV